MKLHNSGLVDPKDVASFGKFLGVEGVYTGTVFIPQTARESYNQPRTDCSGGYHGKGLLKTCNSTSTTYVNCIKKTVQYTIAPRLVEVATAQVIYAPTKTATRQISFCSDAGGEIPDSILLGEAANEALIQVRDDVAPHSYTAHLKLKDSDEGLGDTAKRRFSDAMDFAKANRMDRACEIWSTLAHDNATSLSINYDLAVCDEAEGHVQEALQKYTAIDNGLSKPDADINEALERVRKVVSERQNLSAITPSSEITQITPPPVNKSKKGAKVPKKHKR